MNIKKTIKKISAIATGAALLGATATGAVSADLNEYPEPFVQDGEFNGQVVVGSMGTAAGNAADIVGAIDLVASLQANAVTPVSVGAGGQAVVEGAEEFELFFNEAFPTSGEEVLDANDVPGLVDRSIRFDGSNYDVEENFVINQEGLNVATSLAENDEDYGALPHLNVAVEGVEYRYTFLDELTASDVNDSSSSTELNIEIFGQSLTVLDIDENTMTIEGSQQAIVTEGESVDVDGYTVTVTRVRENTVTVDVNGEQRVHDTTGNEVREYDNGNFEVSLETAPLYEQGADDNAAELRFGEEITMDVDQDDAMELFGEDEDDPEWRWRWSIDDGILEWIGAYNDIPRDLAVVEDDFERPALAPGESMFTPNEYIELSMPGLFDDRTRDVDTRFTTDRFKNDRSESRSDFDREDVLEFTAGGEDVFRLGGADGVRAQSVSILGISADGNLLAGYDDGSNKLRWYDNESEGVVIANTRSQRNAEEMVLNVAVTDTDGNLDTANITQLEDGDQIAWATITFAQTEETLALRLGQSDSVRSVEDTGNEGTGFFGGFDQFGPSDSDAEALDLVYFQGNVSEANLNSIGTRDYDLLTSYGVSFSDPESQLDSDRFSFTTPFERAEAQVLVSAGQTTTTPGQTGGDAYQVNPLPIGQIAVLDSDAPALGSTPMLVVGGPWSNSVADTLLDNPTDEDIEEMFTPGEGKLMWFEDDMALLVAGYDAEDTQAASQVLANFRDYELSGDEVKVMTQDLSVLLVE